MKKNLISKCLVALLFSCLFLLLNFNYNVEASTNEQEKITSVEEFLDTDEKIIKYDSRTNETTEVDTEELKKELLNINSVDNNTYSSLPAYIPYKKTSLNISLNSTTGPVERVLDTTQDSYRATCRIDADSSTGSDDRMYGSASLVGPNLALTAAHCVFDVNNNNTPYPNWNLYAAYNGGIYQNATVTGWKVVYAYEGWKQTHDSNYDIALCVLYENVGDEVGYYGVRLYNSNSGLNGIYTDLLGYPSDTNYGFLSYGPYQYRAPGQITSVSDMSFKHNCFTVKGFSGGPLVHATDVFQVVGVGVGYTQAGKEGFATKITENMYNLIASLR